MYQKLSNDPSSSFSINNKHTLYRLFLTLADTSVKLQGFSNGFVMGLFTASTNPLHHSVIYKGRLN